MYADLADGWYNSDRFKEGAGIDESEKEAEDHLVDLKSSARLLKNEEFFEIIFKKTLVPMICRQNTNRVHSKMTITAKIICQVKNWKISGGKELCHTQQFIILHSRSLSLT